MPVVELDPTLYTAIILPHLRYIEPLLKCDQYVLLLTADLL
jgi:hypothetical protein